MSVCPVRAGVVLRMPRVQVLTCAAARAGPLCQFHTASPLHEAAIASEGPQVWRGIITIAYQHDQLHAAIQRLKALVAQPPLSRTKCAIRPADDGLSYEVSCPYGNRFVLKVASPREAQALSPSSGAGRPGSAASKALGFTSLALPCARGSSASIGKFYSRCFSWPVTLSRCGVEMWGGPGGVQKLEFFEVDGPLPAYTGDHFCVYVSDLQQTFEQCDAAGIVWVNPRFTHLDESRTWHDCERYKQFRLLRLVDESGLTIQEQEHEIRMVTHPSYPLDKRVD